MIYSTSKFQRIFLATKTRLLIVSLLVMAPFTQQVLPISFEKQFGNNALYTELSDPYYVSSGFYLSLTNSPLPTLDSTNERAVYNRLLKNIFAPNCILFEIGLFPLPLAGVAVKEWAPSFYKRATIGNTNIVRTITESVDFKEPWSMSVFLGNLFFFRQKAQKINGQGNVGFLCSYGYGHIKDNGLYKDHWGEFEAKLKLDKSGEEKRYSISYRIGGRINSNPEIKDFMYLGVKHDRTDFSEPTLSLYKNTNVQMRLDCSTSTVEILAFSIEAGKKKPFKWKKHDYAAGLSVGVTWDINNPYTGELGNGFVKNSFTPIVRPLLQF